MEAFIRPAGSTCRVRVEAILNIRDYNHIHIFIRPPALSVESGFEAILIRDLIHKHICIRPPNKRLKTLC